MGLFFPVGSSKVRSRQTDKMLMPKKNLVAIYEHLFKEGCMVAKKDTQAPSSGGFGGDKMDSDRSAYRRAPGAANGADKAGAAGPRSAPMEFRGGFGRGQAE